MWPISDHFHFVSIGAVFFAACALFFLAAARHRLLITVPPVGLAVYATWRFANVGEEEYAGLGVMIAVSALALTLFAAAIWVFLSRLMVRRIAKRSGGVAPGRPVPILTVLIATAPALLVAAFFFERQIVPKAPCSIDGVTFAVGEASYFVPPEFESWIWKGQSASGRPKSIHYSTRTRDKEEMRRLCEATAYGTQPLNVDTLQLSGYSIGPFLQKTCDTVSGEAKGYCTGYSPSMLANIRTVKFARQPDRSISSTQSWFSKKRRDVVAGGDLTDGFVCIEETYNNSFQCSSWRPVRGTTFVFAQTQRVPGLKPDELVRNLDEAIAFFESALTP
ncbi:hypothetical protein LL06_20705 [Hoeflea sp. BAL378]|uniref:hypothetical protein n=1 Tax=Hoeflea sp. BAL378 TaxID=1547437 RepID=UPI0005141E9B|nr:hypothetical protein [Hoeflea sp. BAL378]KGF67708.1 hypothetical protein LL06_20705 [Hoeflea sp. BAL378]